MSLRIRRTLPAQVRIITAFIDVTVIPMDTERALPTKP